MKNAVICCFLLSFVFLSPLCAQSLRSFDDIFPGLTQDEKTSVFSSDGLKRTFEKNDSPHLIPAANSGIDLINVITEKTPSHLVEALFLVPYNEKNIDILDAYNAIGRIKNIKDHLYFANDQNRNIVIFSETTRIESARRKTPIPDPPPSTVLPFSETMYLRLSDASYGTLYIRADISVNRHGLTCSMTNFDAVRFLFFTIIKVEKFSATVYIEPVREGILVYGMAGIELPGFVNRIINVPSEIERRLMVLVNWLKDGLRR